MGRPLDVDEVELDEETFQFMRQRAELLARVPGVAVGLCQCSTRFDERQADADEAVGTEPDVSGRDGAVLLDEQRDDGRGVEVGDQRRCSATSSDTAPLAFSGVGRLRFRC